MQNVVRAFVPRMVAAKSGVIVNFSSGLGHSTNPMLGAYTASKFAVEALTKSIAQALPEGMAAVPLAPGVVYGIFFCNGLPPHPSTSVFVCELEDTDGVC